MTSTDSLKRDDSRVLSAFDAHTPRMRQALRRAAARGSANLPAELGEGWLMVPTRNGSRQVAYQGSRAWVF